MFLRAQWVKLNNLRRDNYTNFNDNMLTNVLQKLGGPPYTCIPIRTNLLNYLSMIIQVYIVDKGLCDRLGCPLTLPMIKNANNTVYYRQRKTDITCIQVGI